MTLKTITVRPSSPQKSQIAAAVGFATLLALPVLAPAQILTAEPPFIDLDPGAPAGSSVLAIISSGENGGIGGFQFFRAYPMVLDWHPVRIRTT